MKDNPESPNLSFDGQIRIPDVASGKIALSHLHSDLYDQTDISSDATVLKGFTEWSSNDNPSLSIGWDFEIHLFKQPIFKISSSPFSNIRFLNESGIDLAEEENAKVLIKVIDALEWRHTVIKALGLQITI